MKKIALITGATSGIGRATAIALADEGYNLILTGRRKERLEELQALVGVTYKADALVLNFDVRNQEEVAKAVASIPAAWRKIDVLVNNIGICNDNSLEENKNIHNKRKLLHMHQKSNINLIF